LLLLTLAMKVGAIEPNVGQPASFGFGRNHGARPNADSAECAVCGSFVNGASHRAKADAEEAAIRAESQISGIT